MGFAFTGSVAFATVRPVFPEETVALDLNRDGRLDLVTAFAAPPLQSGGFDLQVLLNSGNGVFFDNTFGSFTGFPPRTINPSDLVLADFNRDDFPDLFVADAGRLDASPFLGAQNSLVLSASGFWFNATGNLPGQVDVTTSASAADVDRDGDVDLYVGNTLGFLQVPPAILLNDGQGAFSVGVARLPPPQTDVLLRNYTASQFIDANVDGWPDLFLGGESATASVLLPNRGGGFFGPPLANAIPAKPFGPNAIAVDAYAQDVNGDGIQDLFVLYTRGAPAFTDRAVQLLMGSGDGTFVDETAERIVSIPNEGPWIRHLEFGDFDRDGSIDFITEPATGAPEILLNNGEGYFFRPVNGVLPNVPVPFQIGDFNGDATLDIAAWSAPTNALLFFPSDGLFPYRTTGTPQDDRLFGTGRDDTLDGAGGNDTLRPGPGDDLLLGRAGNDTLVGGQGDDVLNGGEGIDVALFSGAFRQYTVDASAGTVSGPDGADTFTAVEDLSWLDGRLAFDANDHMAQAYRLYFATLDREPDALGLNYQSARLDAGTSLADVAAGFVASPEFQATYGPLNDPQFVELLYQNVLDRSASPDEIAYHVNRLQAGASRSEVVVGFSESPEHVQKHIDAINAGLWDIDEDAASVARLYFGALDRAPEVRGLAYWTDAIENGRPLAQVGDAFVSSPEFQATYGNLDNNQFVTQLYLNVLDRAPDAGGLEYWVGELDAGMSRGTVTVGFTESLEYQIDTLSLVDRGIAVAEAGAVL